MSLVGYVLGHLAQVKAIKGSRDSGFSLVSTENLSETFPSCGWGPGRDNIGQKCLNLPYL